jgi:hypothetical protein
VTDLEEEESAMQAEVTDLEREYGTLELEETRRQEAGEEEEGA